MDKVLLSHGGGGTMMERLIEEVFAKAFDNEHINAMEDAALLFGNIAITTDSFTVKPIFFPGGDIGRLAVCGTVNDASMRGAKPLYLTSAFIIEEGYPIEDLKRIVKSMAEAAEEAGVKIVAGDTKVVENGGIDGVFINTSGIGVVYENVDVSIKNARPGDVVLISGTIGDHGMAIMSAREELQFDPPILSDVSPLNKLIEKLMTLGKAVKVLRDPTRGGVAEVLYEISKMSGVGIKIYEDKLPVKESVKSACDLMGFDFLHLANEGKLIAVVDRKYAEEALEIMKSDKYGKDAAIIGEVNDSKLVTINTVYGTSRIIDRPIGELLPRIC
ncbi:hydrogenase expression/formation protein HypE [Thermoanaerobacter thermohydrosulfuricus]|uniref:Hydrogenase expression/formation protein HypE n=2 Tax=Thermoanaerobacter thermohydrosulfuricus TaxID=1516 RepID=M8DSA9_THETY|nr:MULTISPECIES: hydrogenase expression/formation protein HypE [Thermoanaerobacter]EMT39371.1 hydrogenase expression/formation protein HypE [Thermoanaerobacter thermohydrosulfuricus WC1]UZQ83145.1 hydrogenase expression/formation protein HypE [Thermoanaerobacter sp. RKWS2]SDF99248.1 hydrogenase expression/formation protein HypE [Thermoanaerobacter thermohydrosulfuricus]SFE69331.1 hydrogenase expression/formation protein HypE [Thermoanaerobacter thermohydrosulfuricus]